MKTKSLVMSAAVALAGAVSCFADPVYSVNVVGYVNQVIPAGFSIIGNQLNATPNNTVTNIFKSPVDGLTVYKYRVGGGYDIISYTDGIGWEGLVDMTMNPGEGVFVSTSVQYTNTFVGEIPMNTTNTLREGYQILAPVLPAVSMPGAVQPNQDLGMTTVDGDAIYIYRGAGLGYGVYAYTDGIGWEPEAPTITVGQGFFFSTGTARPWVKTYVP